MVPSIAAAAAAGRVTAAVSFSDEGLNLQVPDRPTISSRSTAGSSRTEDPQRDDGVTGSPSEILLFISTVLVGVAQFEGPLESKNNKIPV